MHCHGAVPVRVTFLAGRPDRSRSRFQVPGEPVMFVQGALPSQGANVEKPWRSSDGEMTYLQRPAMQIHQQMGYAEQ